MTVDTVRFLVDDRCNYACWYCSRKPTPQDIKKLTHLLKGGVLNKLELELKFEPRDSDIIDATTNRPTVITEDFDFSKYDKAIITGGEPLMWPSELQLLCPQAVAGCRHVTIETNGLMLDAEKFDKIHAWGVTRVDVNLYLRDALFKQVDQVLELADQHPGMEVQFTARKGWEFLETHYPEEEFLYFEDWTESSSGMPFEIPENEIAVMWKKEEHGNP